MEEPTATLPAQKQGPDRLQSALSWAALIVVVGLLVGGQLYQYFSPDDKPGEDPTYAALEAQAQLSLWFADLAKPATGSAGADAVKSLADSWEEQRKDAGKSLGLARVWVPVAHELGLKPDRPALGLLQESEDPGDQAIAAVYTGSLAPESLEPLRAADGFSARLAEYHGARALGRPADRSHLFPPGVMLAKAAVMVGFAGALAAGLVLLLVFLAVARKTPQAGYPPGPTDRGAAARKALRMAVYLLGFTLALVGAGAILPSSWSGMVRAAIAMTIVLVPLAAWLNLPLFGGRDDLRTLLGKTDRPWRLAAIGLWTWLAVLPLVVGSAALMTSLFAGLPKPSHPTTVEIAGKQSGAEIVATYVLAAVLAPLIEEFTFRGLLFPALRAWMPWVAAAALGGLVFAAIHPQGPLLWASLGLLGFAGAVAAQYTGSLIPALVMHAANNAAVLTLALVMLQ
jgi:membrane protease YdiL (CAAX protease family)